MARETHLPMLFQLFRQYGYDGVSLSRIAAETELGKASLYHHFPGGKAEMVSAALAYDGLWMEENVLAVLRSPGSLLSRFERMSDRLSELYSAGESPCLLTALTTGMKQDVFHDQVKDRLERWIKAIALVLMEAGLDAQTARQRSEDALVAIQGSLVLSRGLGDLSVFRRAIARLPKDLCEGL